MARVAMNVRNWGVSRLRGNDRNAVVSGTVAQAAGCGHPPHPNPHRPGLDPGSRCLSVPWAGQGSAAGFGLDRPHNAPLRKTARRKSGAPGHARGDGCGCHAMAPAPAPAPAPASAPARAVARCLRRRRRPSRWLRCAGGRLRRRGGRPVCPSSSCGGFRRCAG